MPNPRVASASGRGQSLLTTIEGGQKQSEAERNALSSPHERASLRLSVAGLAQRPIDNRRQAIGALERTCAGHLISGPRRTWHRSWWKLLTTIEGGQKQSGAEMNALSSPHERASLDNRRQAIGALEQGDRGICPSGARASVVLQRCQAPEAAPTQLRAGGLTAVAMSLSLSELLLLRVCCTDLQNELLEAVRLRQDEERWSERLQRDVDCWGEIPLTMRSEGFAARALREARTPALFRHFCQGLQGSSCVLRQLDAIGAAAWWVSDFGAHREERLAAVEFCGERFLSNEDRDDVEFLRALVDRSPGVVFWPRGPESRRKIEEAGLNGVALRQRPELWQEAESVGLLSRHRIDVAWTEASKACTFLDAGRCDGWVQGNLAELLAL